MRAEFDESLVTGNEMIDSQHKELIDKINKLLDTFLRIRRILYALSDKL